MAWYFLFYQAQPFLAEIIPGGIVYNGYLFSRKKMMEVLQNQLVFVAAAAKDSRMKKLEANSFAKHGKAVVI